MTRLKKYFGVCLLAPFVVLTGAKAEDCALKLAAAVTIEKLPGGGIAVPVKIAGVERKMLLSIDTPHSAITEALRQSSGFETKRLPSFVHVVYAGEDVTTEAVLPEIRMGVASGTDYEVLLLAEPPTQGVDGILGLDFLSNFDMELDVKAGKLNLFSPDHCPGKVVYWGAPYAALPFKTDPVGHTYFDMTLDGKPVTVGLDSEFMDGEMGMNDARSAFGLEANDPALKPLNPVAVHVPLYYRYPFKTLSLSGIEVRNPTIDIIAQSMSERCDGKLRLTADGHGYRDLCYGGPNVVLGVSVLRQLHLYFAFGEKMLYATAAGSAPDSSKPAPTTPSH